MLYKANQIATQKAPLFFILAYSVSFCIVIIVVLFEKKWEAKKTNLKIKVSDHNLIFHVGPLHGRHGDNPTEHKTKSANKYNDFYMAYNLGNRFVGTLSGKQ